MDYGIHVRRIALSVTTLVAIFVYLTNAPQYIGLESTLIIAVAGFVAINIYFSHYVRLNLSDEISEVESTVEDEARATRDALDRDEPLNRDEPRTDGSGGWQPVQGLRVDDVEASTVPTVAGGLLGGILGAPFGPYSAGIGVVLGAALAGGLEYNNLKDQHRKRLDRAAWSALRYMSGYDDWQADIEEIDDVRASGEQYWRYRFVDNHSGEHLVRINKSTGDIEYRKEKGGGIGLV